MTSTLPRRAEPESPPERPRPRGRDRRLVLLVGGVVVSALLVTGCVAVGSSGVSPGDVFRAIRLAVFGGVLTTDFQRDYGVIIDLRLPRALLAFAAGASLSLAGAVMQGLLRNPLVSPFTLGVSPAAAFGAALAILLTSGTGGSQWLIVGSALVTSLLVTALVLGIASARALSTATLLLLGIALTQLFEALTAGMQYLADENTLQAIVRWTFGSVNDANWTDVRIVGGLALVMIPVLTWFAKDINAIAFAGDDAAKSLGINVSVVRPALIGGAVLLAAVTVSFCGVIGFVGLVGPHIARLVIGADHRFLLPFSALSGGALLLAADTVGRTIIAPSVIPVGIVVAFVGAPIFIHLILRRKAAR